MRPHRTDVGRHSARATLIAFVAALAGTAVSSYLTWVHYTEPSGLSCPDTGAINCVRVTTSPESMLFGVIPVALAGAVFFAVMAVVTLPWAWRVRSVWLDRARVAAVVAGVGMALYLLGVEMLGVRSLCLWCTAAHALAYVLFVAVLWATLVPPETPGRAPAPH